MIRPLIAACLLVAACQPRTEIVLGFATDLHATGELDNIQLHITRTSDGLPEGGDGLAWGITGVVDVPVNLPASFGVYSDDEDVQLDVSLSATRGTTPIVTQHAVLSLVSGKTLFYRLGLTDACAQVQCGAAETCVEGMCRAAMVDRLSLPAFIPELVDHLSCDSGTAYIDTATGALMPLLASAGTCPPENCDQGTCMRGPVGGGNGGNGFVGGAHVYVKASNPGMAYQFGQAVAVSADGNTMAVSAFREASASTGVGGAQNNVSAPQSGAVYIFTRSGMAWSQQAYIKATNTDLNDKFGFSVALSSDGNTLAVGSEAESSASPGIDGNQADNSLVRAGAVYVYTRAGTTWSSQAYIKPMVPQGNAQFGSAVALSADGNTLGVGANNDSSNATGIDGNATDTSLIMAGAGYVFTRTGTTWTQQAYLKSSTAGANLFGSSMAISKDGNTLAVGAVTEKSNAVGINGDETDTSAPDSGAVYVFTRTGTTWTQQAYVKASNTDPSDDFGNAIALAGDGNTLAVGAYREASAATGVDGNQLDNTSGFAGAVYTYRRTGTTWAQQSYIKASNAEASDQFGDAVALSADGATLAVGATKESGPAMGLGGDQTMNTAFESGAVYVFASAGGTWTQLAYAKASNTEGGDSFGNSLALSSGGGTLAIGAFNEAGGATGIEGNQQDNTVSGAGAVYVYQ